MSRYRRKTEMVEAVYVGSDNLIPVLKAFCGPALEVKTIEDGSVTLWVDTGFGVIQVGPGMFIVKHSDSKPLTVMSEESFNDMYERMWG